jgi:hypothetical protein
VKKVIIRRCINCSVVSSFFFNECYHFCLQNSERQRKTFCMIVSVSDGTNCSGHIVMSTTDVRMNVLCPLHVTRHFVLWPLLSLKVVRQTRKAEAVPWREVLETCAAGGQVFLCSDGRYPCFFVTSCSLTAMTFSTFMTDENPASGYSTDPEKYHRPSYTVPEQDMTTQHHSEPAQPSQHFQTELSWKERDYRIVRPISISTSIQPGPHTKRVRNSSILNEGEGYKLWGFPSAVVSTPLYS